MIKISVNFVRFSGLTTTNHVWHFTKLRLGSGLGFSRHTPMHFSEASDAELVRSDQMDLSLLQIRSRKECLGGCVGPSWSTVAWRSRYSSCSSTVRRVSWGGLDMWIGWLCTEGHLNSTNWVQTGSSHSRDVETRSTRSAVQPGFLTYRHHLKASPLVNVVLHLEGQKIRLDRGPRGWVQLYLTYSSGLHPSPVIQQGFLSYQTPTFTWDLSYLCKDWVEHKTRLGASWTGFGHNWPTVWEIILSLSYLCLKFRQPPLISVLMTH